MKNAGLYIHIPFCISKCSYCDFYSIPGSIIPESYINRLIQEHTYRKNQANALWSSVYVGGGTPSLLSEKQISVLFNTIRQNCTRDAEITFECNPDDVRPELICVLKDSGVTRISLGIQTFSNEKLKFCKRRSSKEINEKALELIQKADFPHFSADLITGLPPFKDDQNQLFYDISSLLSFGVDHISLYSLTLEEGTPLFDQVMHNPELLDESSNDELWIKGRDFLEAQGFTQYEVSNFASEKNQSIHNKKYWNMEDYAGIGAGATGTLYKGSSALRFTNTRNIDDYLHRDFSDQEEKLILNLEECMNEYLMMGFRTLNGINPSVFYERFGIPLSNRIEPFFTTWQNNQKAVITPDGNYALNRNGLLFLNTFLMEILI